MNEEQLKGNWKQLKGRVQAKWGELTNDELDQINGRREELEGKIQEKYGHKKEEARAEIDKFLDSVDL